MKKLFVPYELALLAKEKGFDETCFAAYEDFENKELAFRTIFQSNSDFKTEYSELCKYQCSAPLYQQLVDWLETLHGLEISTKSWKKEGSKIEIVWVYSIKKLGLPSTFKFDKTFNSKNQALNTVLTESFKLI